METAASFEARFAPSSYPTGPLGQSSGSCSNGGAQARHVSRHSTGSSTVEAVSTKGGGKPNAALDSRLDGKALSEMLALKPERQCGEVKDVAKWF